MISTDFIGLESKRSKVPSEISLLNDIMDIEGIKKRSNHAFKLKILW